MSVNLWVVYIYELAMTQMGRERERGKGYEMQWYVWCMMQSHICTVKYIIWGKNCSVSCLHWASTYAQTNFVSDVFIHHNPIGTLSFYWDWWVCHVMNTGLFITLSPIPLTSIMYLVNTNYTFCSIKCPPFIPVTKAKHCLL